MHLHRKFVHLHGSFVHLHGELVHLYEWFVHLIVSYKKKGRCVAINISIISKIEFLGWSKYNEEQYQKRYRVR
jgi:hypothetical protein